jgi:hypothetical protein
MTIRRLGIPHPTQVGADSQGRPEAIAGEPVEAAVEEWVVEDRWWTGRPLRRRYFELVLSGGRNAVVFRDLSGDRWFEQRG